MERNSENRNRYGNDRNGRQQDQYDNDQYSNDRYNDPNQFSDYQQRNQAWDQDENHWRTGQVGNRYNRQNDNNRNERRLQSMGSLGSDFGRSDYSENFRNDQRNQDSYGNNGYRNSAYGNNHDYRRNWWNKTKDEVSGWFGDENAQQRREQDQAGEHRGKGPKGYVRTDERIKEDIHERLTEDATIDASEIEVDVRSGEVFLKGTVRTRQEKRKAEDIIENVSGVKDIENHIKLQQENAQSANAGQRTGQYGENKFGINSGSTARTANTGEYSTHN